MTNPFSKTAYNKQANYNNFLGDGESQQYNRLSSREQYRTSSTATGTKPRTEKLNPTAKKIKEGPSQLRDSPYYSKEVQRRSIGAATHSKPILSGFKNR